MSLRTLENYFIHIILFSYFFLFFLFIFYFGMIYFIFWNDSVSFLISTFFFELFMKFSCIFSLFL